MIRNVGQVTAAIFRLRTGDRLFLRGPYGQPFPLPEFVDQHLLLIAGGSGVAAIKPLADYYFGNAKNSLKRIDLLLGFRSPKQLLYRKELKQWGKRSGVMLTVDTQDDDNSWAGGIGFVVNFVKEVKGLGSDTRVVVVGPPLMITNTVRELCHYDVREENIWLSLERHMKCGIGKCGHCRICDKYVCQDGPVFNYQEAKSLID